MAFLGIALALPSAGSAWAAVAAKPPAAPAPLTAEQALSRRQLGGLRASPDGRRVAFTVGEPPKEEAPRRHVWVLEIGVGGTAGSRDARQFTNSPKSEWEPRWSPDGRTLAFLSDREERPQVWTMPVDGGEATRLTEGKSGVEAFEWSPDGQSIAYLAAEPKSDAEEKKEKEKDDARLVDRDDRPARLWLFDLAAKKARQLTHAPWRLSELAWAPAGDRLYVVATDHPESDQWTDRIVAVEIADSDGKVTPLAVPRGPFGGLRVAPDGGALAYVGARVDGPVPHDLWLLPLAKGGADGPARNLTGENIDRAVEGFVWRADGSLVVLGADGFDNRLFAVTVEGKAQALAGAPAVTTDFVALAGSAPAGPPALALVADRAAEPAEVWLWTPGDKPVSATRLNEAARALPAIAPEILRYKSFDGTEIEGALLLPKSLAKGARAPLVVLVHGGPTGHWRDRFEPWGQMLAARGFAVFYPNVRGSDGYGIRFLEMNRGDWGGGDFKDVMAGVDFLIARGIADPQRLGIGGWSYGGYMAEWAITQTTRFQAAVTGAGMSDLASEFGTENGSAYDEWFYGLPYENAERFWKSSPIQYVKAAKTPTLILQGEADATDPIGQSQQLYRALKRYGVTTDFVVYPREGHGIREEKHQLDRLNRVIDWFAKYLREPGGAPAPKTAPKTTTGGSQ